MPVLDLRQLDGWLLLGLLMLIAWLPLPIGSNHPLAIGVMEVAVFALLAVWMLARGWSAEAAPRPVFAGGAARWVLGLLLAWLAYHLLQVLPLPLEVIGWLNPTAADVYRYADETGARLFTLSLDPGLSLQAFLQAAAYVGLLVLVMALINTRERVRLLVYVMLAVVTLEALWGIAGIYATPAVRARGTYINPNHFAGLLELGIGLTLGWLLTLGAARQRHSHWRQRLSGLLQSVNGRNLRLYGYLALLILFGALVLSASRGGILAMLAAISLMFAVAAAVRGSQGRALRLLGVALLALLAGAVVFGADLFLKRLDQSFLEAEGRRQTATATVLMIQSYPVLGSGSGTWGTLYPMFKAPEAHSMLKTENAHNDHLELLAEQGVIGYMLLGGAILVAIGVNLLALRRGDALIRGLSFGCALGMLSLLIHAWVEFNFHIPANAAWFWVVLALGLAVSALPDTDTKA
ncbi:O-antigen ligase family protein [Halochromatium salexigens]|nr:O-antigen ligase family protein [Halochromatium salexigens]